jgi:hypothetical protein
MKNLTFLILAIILGVAVLAQTPQSFRYQAVARDNSGNILANQSVSFRISILSGSVSGTAVYIETHTGLSTNAFGLVELEIGKGTPVTGTFSSINWGSNTYFVKVEMDPEGGGTYQTLSTSQLLSVPYALYSEKAGNGFSGDYNDLFNRPLLFDGTWVSLTGKPTEFNPSAHVHSAGNITSGTLPAKYGGTGISSYKAGNYIYASGMTTLDLRTPAEVLTDIKASPLNHTHSAGDITGILPVLNGGTGASTAAVARTNLGATTVGSLLFTLPNPSAIRFIKVDADNSIKLRTAADFRTDIGAGTGNGTVTSIATSTGITGGPIASSGTISLTGQALALHNFYGAGLMVRTGSSAYAARTITAGVGIAVSNGNGLIGNPVISASNIFEIGDFAHGGVVFWVDDTGEHGLVCAKNDQSIVRWYAGTYLITMARGNGPLSGEMNTAIIIASQGGGDGYIYAARTCAELQQTEASKTYGDWYLPSRQELLLMYNNKAIINATANANGGWGLTSEKYFSSTEFSSNSAWYVDFSNGAEGTDSKSQSFRVRAVRRF